MARLSFMFSAAEAIAAVATARRPARAPASREKPSQRHAAAKKARTVDREDCVSSLEATPRTVEVLMSEVRYGIVFATMNEVFNGRMHRLMNWAVALGVGFTATGFIGHFADVGVRDFSQWWAFAWAAIGVVAGASNKVFNFAAKETAYRKAKQQFLDLEAKGWDMTAAALLRDLNKLIGDAPSGGRWLAEIAYNRTCEQLGRYEYKIPVPPFRRIIGATL
jgi:hypothetical protein